jgi:hypothetical protein
VCRSLRSCTPFKENKESKMKKTYFSPDMEIVKLNIVQPLMLGSNEKEDITGDPVPIVTPDPNDDEDDGGW